MTASRDPFDDLHAVCRHCGRTSGEHGHDDNMFRPRACPGDGRFPRRADYGDRESWNAAVDRYWTQRETTFEPAGNGETAAESGEVDR